MVIGRSLTHSPRMDAEELTKRRIYLFRDNFRVGLGLGSVFQGTNGGGDGGAAEWFFDSFNSIGRRLLASSHMCARSFAGRSHP